MGSDMLMSMEYDVVNIVTKQYSAQSAVIRAVRGKKPDRTTDSTKFPYSDKVTKCCRIVRTVLSLVLLGSKVHYYTMTKCRRPRRVQNSENSQYPNASTYMLPNSETSTK